MAKSLRIEFSDALYHVTSRGDRREVIYDDDEDRNNRGQITVVAKTIGVRSQLLLILAVTVI